MASSLARSLTGRLSGALSGPRWGTAVSAFTPASLFASGEQGVWYDPSDLTTLFQDAAGTTPVTAVEQPVGLMLDKSKGLVLGPELVTNGDFSQGSTGWLFPLGTSFSISGGQAAKTATDSARLYGTLSLPLVSGRAYRLTFDLTITSGVVDIRLRTGTGGGATSPSPAYTTSGSKSCIFFATEAHTTVGFHADNTAALTVDNVSLKELPGNHATQSTAASRPVLSARVNLLTKTEEFQDAVWVKTNSSISANSTVAPDGTTTADAWAASAASADHWLYGSSGVADTTGTVTASVCIKQNGYSKVQFGVYRAGSSRWAAQLFDLSTGAITTKYEAAGATVTSASIVDLGGGWKRLSLTAAAGAVISSLIIVPLSDSASTATIAPTYTGDGTSGIYIWGADLRVANDGVGLPAYQRVNTATDYDASASWPRYLRFDGTDDSLATGSINFSSTDKMSVFAGVRKLSDAATGIFAELSSNINGNNGSFAIWNGDNTASGPTYRTPSKGTLLASPNIPSSYASPISNIITLIADISADIAIARVNGGQVASSSSDQGTGNFGTYPLYIGRRGGSSFPFSGRLYSLIVRGAASTTKQITDTETWVNARTKAY